MNPCNAYADLWLKLEIRPDDGVQYHSCLLCYVDNIFCIHHNADALIQWSHKSFPIKQGFVSPDMQLGMKLHKTRLHNGVWAWTSFMKYVHEAVRNCKTNLVANVSSRQRLPKRADDPFKLGYDSELDISPELETGAAPSLQTITSVLRLTIKFRRIDIMMEVSSSLSYGGAFRCSSACHGLCRSEV